MLPSGLARLRTYFFETPMNLSKGNILCRNTGPRMEISSTRWTSRCVIILKKDGGNTNSKLTRHWTTSFCNHGRSSGLIIFWEIALRNAHSFTMGTRTLSGRSPLNAIRSICVIITWQSWDFRFWNSFSAIFIIPFIFDEKPDGTLILLRHSNITHNKYICSIA